MSDRRLQTEIDWTPGDKPPQDGAYLVLVFSWNSYRPSDISEQRRSIRVCAYDSSQGGWQLDDWPEQIISKRVELWTPIPAVLQTIMDEWEQELLHGTSDLEPRGLLSEMGE